MFCLFNKNRKDHTNLKAKFVILILLFFFVVVYHSRLVSLFVHYLVIQCLVLTLSSLSKLFEDETRVSESFLFVFLLANSCSVCHIFLLLFKLKMKIVFYASSQNNLFLKIDDISYNHLNN